MVQNDRKLYDSLFELRVRAFDRSSPHRGGEERRRAEASSDSLGTDPLLSPACRRTERLISCGKSYLARLRGSDNRRV